MKNEIKSVLSKGSLEEHLEMIKLNRALTPAERELLDKFIKVAKEKGDNFNANSKILKRLEKLHIPGQKMLAVTEEGVKNFFSNAVKRELKRGYPEPVIDSEIWGSIFPNTVFSATEEFYSHLYSFPRASMPYVKLLEEADNYGIKEIYSPLEALSIARELVLNDFVDELLATVIYFSSEGSPVYLDGTIFCCCVHRIPTNPLLRDWRLKIKIRQYNASKNRPAIHQVCFR